MRSRSILIGVGAGLVALLLWFLLLWQPQSGRLQEASDRRETAEAENARLELERDRLRAAQERAPQLQATVDRLRVAIPNQPELAQFLLAANDAAQQSGVEFLSISPSPPTPAEGDATLSQVNLSISVAGGYFQVLDYLNRLDALPRLVVVDTLAVSPGAGDAGTPAALSVSVSARMFTTASPDAAADSPPPAPDMEPDTPAPGDPDGTDPDGGTDTENPEDGP
jgi:Tfp pilus assembly protein PilO